MSRKNTVVAQIAVNQSLASSFTTIPTIVRYLDNCSYQINIATTDSTGTFSLQASNDYFVEESSCNAPVNAGNWIDLTLSGGTPTVAATNDNIIINLNQLPFYAIRLKYTPSTTGTGTCSIYTVDKSIGA